jgi:hypothetical protein
VGKDIDMTDELRRPLAWLPIALSLTALALVAGYALTVSPLPSGGDEGGPARIFQLLMAAQVPIVLWFVATSGSRRRGVTAAIVALQVLVALVPVALVSVLEG